MSRYAEPSNFYADSSEDEASGHSSIFHASIYIAEEESIQVLEKGKQSWASTSTTIDVPTTYPTTTGPLVLDRESSHEHDHIGPETRLRSHLDIVSDEGTLGTSVDSCTTLVPTLRDRADTLNDPGDGEGYHDGSRGERNRDAGKEKFIVYNPVDQEPLFVYASPKEPTESPPILPGPQPQRRADTVAEILFRQGTQFERRKTATPNTKLLY
ncbi:hypothetical protein ABW21_db0207657 [Orbilia brochopaga]|nr:hypothetical protein ABW21_db0207657 [Drechslerella brochopaga]